MDVQFINISLAFLEGFALIISPCILPILPIILSSSLDGGKKRPLGIIVGFILVFSLFTFFSKKIVQLSGIDLNLVRYISFGLLLLLGVIMLSTYLTEQFSRLTQRVANIGSGIAIFNKPDGGFISGILFGSLIGFIWTPCAGPILAAVIVQTVLQTTNISSFFTILFFGIGAAVPMLIIALFGRKIMTKFTFFKNQSVLFRKILGAIIIISVIFIITENGVAFTSSSTSLTTSNTLQDGLFKTYPAPAITGITDWINSTPLQLSDLKGKVVLIDFWAYSCINCIRTLPYLNSWYEKYHDQGLVIIGIHAPEFDFERNLNNVKTAVQHDKIQYPVALDNNFSTWQNYHNSYWPAHYLISKNGDVVYTHFGEGDYDIAENNIRFLLDVKTPETEKIIPENISNAKTPETYLGYARAQSFSSPEETMRDQASLYSYPNTLSEDAWALNGSWIIAAQKITATQPNAAIKIHFNAEKVYAVMGNNSQQPLKVKLYLSGKLINTLTITNHTLYTLIENKHPISGVLELITSEPGLELYTFTFG